MSIVGPTVLVSGVRLLVYSKNYNQVFMGLIKVKGIIKLVMITWQKLVCHMQAHQK